MREQIMGTDPLTPPPFLADFSRWNSTLARVSWPSAPGTSYSVFAGQNVKSLVAVTNLSGVFRESEWFVPYTNAMQFFNVRTP